MSMKISWQIYVFRNVCIINMSNIIFINYQISEKCRKIGSFRSILVCDLVSKIVPFLGGHMNFEVNFIKMNLHYVEWSAWCQIFIHMFYYYACKLFRRIIFLHGPRNFIFMKFHNNLIVLTDSFNCSPLQSMWRS